MPLGKVWTPFSSQLWVKQYHYCFSRRIALAVNNQQKLCYILTYAVSHLHIHTIIKTQEDFFNKIFTSHFIARVQKGLLKVCVWVGAGDRTKTVIFWPPTLMAINVVSFSFSWCSTGGPGVHCAGCWLSLLHLISNFSGPQNPSGFPRAPTAGCGFPYNISSITHLRLYCNWTELEPELNCLDFRLDWAI